LLFCDIDPFELSAILSENRSDAKAKAGQIAPTDIEIKEGPTELVPGPAISQLGSLGIKVAVEDGKITIKENKVIVKKGEKINETAADLMAKLDIKPFKVGFNPVVAYDNKEGKFYEEIQIDKEKTIEELKEKARKAFSFAYSISWITKEILPLILGKIKTEVDKLSELIKNKEEIKEEKEEEKEREDTQKN